MFGFKKRNDKVTKKSVKLTDEVGHIFEKLVECRLIITILKPSYRI